MKRAGKSIIPLLFVFFLSFLQISCEEPDETSAYSFKIVASGDNFYGYYTIDDDDMVEFTGSPMGTSGNYYSYTKEIKTASSLVINADGDSSTTSAITIYIYEGTELLEFESFTPSVSGGVVNALMTYDFGSSSD